MNDQNVSLFQQIIELALDSGRMIRTSQLHINLTYGDYLKSAWQPDVIREINTQVIRKRSHPGDVLWPEDYPSVLLGMNRYLLVHDRPLPPFKMTARFVSGPLEKGNGLLSTLIISWLQDAPNPFLSTENDALIRALDWENMAEEYEY
jgi:hypothetical protein